jgi:hypothetical protein
LDDDIEKNKVPWGPRYGGGCVSFLHNVNSAVYIAIYTPFSPFSSNALRFKGYNGLLYSIAIIAISILYCKAVVVSPHYTTVCIVCGVSNPAAGR